MFWNVMIHYTCRSAGDAGFCSGRLNVHRSRLHAIKMRLAGSPLFGRYEPGGRPALLWFPFALASGTSGTSALDIWCDKAVLCPLSVGLSRSGYFSGMTFSVTQLAGRLLEKVLEKNLLVLNRVKKKKKGARLALYP